MRDGQEDRSRDRLLNKVQAYCKEQSAKSRKEMCEHAKESTNRRFNTGYCMGYAHALESVADMLDGKEIVKRA